jgi:phage shock protein PspC (stress-responsive transcriptional regulator)
MNQEYQNQPNPESMGPNPGQPGPGPEQSQYNQQQQQQQSGPQPGASKPSLADELRGCWEAYQQTKKVAEELGDNPELKATVEETAYKKFKEDVQEKTTKFFEEIGPETSSKKSSWFSTKRSINTKLYRSEKEKMIAGVCGGLSEYFDFDVTVIRVIFVIAALPLPFTMCIGLLVYLVMALILPVKSEAENNPNTPY